MRTSIVELAFICAANAQTLATLEVPPRFSCKIADLTAVRAEAATLADIEVKLTCNAMDAQVDFLPLVRTPEWTSSKGFWSDDPVCLHARAKYVRRWLRSQPEKRIVLVSHGTFLRYLVSRAKTNDCFANGEVRR